MNFSWRKRAAACFLVIDLLEECTEDESGESWWKRGRTKGETKAECKNWWKNCEWRTLPLTTKCSSWTVNIWGNIDRCRAFDYQNSWPKANMNYLRVVKRGKLSSSIMKNLNKFKMNDSWWQPMIVHDSWWSNGSARFNYHRLSSISIHYHGLFDQGFIHFCKWCIHGMLVLSSREECKSDSRESGLNRAYSSL